MYVSQMSEFHTRWFLTGMVCNDRQAESEVTKAEKFKRNIVNAFLSPQWEGDVFFRRIKVIFWLTIYFYRNIRKAILNKWNNLCEINLFLIFVGFFPPHASVVIKGKVSIVVREKKNWSNSLDYIQYILYIIRDPKPLPNKNNITSFDSQSVKMKTNNWTKLLKKMYWEMIQWFDYRTIILNEENIPLWFSSFLAYKQWIKLRKIKSSTFWRFSTVHVCAFFFFFHFMSFYQTWLFPCFSSSKPVCSLHSDAYVSEMRRAKTRTISISFKIWLTSMLTEMTHRFFSPFRKTFLPFINRTLCAHQDIKCILSLLRSFNVHSLIIFFNMPNIHVNYLT